MKEHKTNSYTFAGIFWYGILECILYLWDSYNQSRRLASNIYDIANNYSDSLILHPATKNQVEKNIWHRDKHDRCWYHILSPENIQRN